MFKDRSGNLGPTFYVLTAVVDFYSSLGRVVESKMLFDEMPERDGFAWSTMIEAHEGVGDLASEKSLFDEITEKKHCCMEYNDSWICESKRC